jgi:hypothetical protein
LKGANITGDRYKSASTNYVTVSISGGDAQITVSSTNCTLGGNNNSQTVPSTGGTASFNNLIAATAGSNCTLSASATGATGATSNPFNVKVGSLAFAPSPGNVLSGVAITSTPYNNPKGSSVAVQLYLDGAQVNDDTFNGTNVTVAAAGCLAPVAGSTSATVTNGLATFSSLTAASVASDTPCNLNTTATNFTSPPNPPGAPFLIKAVALAPVACGGALVANGNQNDPLAPFFVDGNRGALNKDGSCSQTPVGYSLVTNPGNKQVTLIWDTTAGGQPNAAFSYTVTSALPFPDNGWPSVPQPKLAWKVYTDTVAGDHNAGDPVFIPAQGCDAPILPKQYSTGSIGQGAGSQSLMLSPAVDTSTLPSTPFPIVMETERMLVITVNSGSSWTVQRGDGGTGTNPPSSHTSVPVMSTPLPLLTQAAVAGKTQYYTQGTPAQMCIASQSWGANGLAGSPPGVPQIIYFTNVLDIGDGWYSQD